MTSIQDRAFKLIFDWFCQRMSLLGKMTEQCAALSTSCVGSKVRRPGIFCYFSLLVVILTFICLRYLPHYVRLPVGSKRRITFNDTLDYGARPAVETRTSWNAPIMWDGMFDPSLYDQAHIKLHTTVALTVFAVGRYLDAYLNTFLISAEQHFMLALPVTYYVFTDEPEKVPKLQLGPERNMKVVRVKRYSRWQDISMMRMKTISEAIDGEIGRHFDYIFCFDVDQEFKGRFGSEALGDSVALLHAHFYKLPKERYTYDKNPESRAFLEAGDYYYHAAIFGGSCENVKNLADTCLLNIVADKINNVEAKWHDESHLNKYFWLHKPSKLLSPEYCWDPSIGDNRDIQVTRLLWAPKHYDKLRI